MLNSFRRIIIFKMFLIINIILGISFDLKNIYSRETF